MNKKALITLLFFILAFLSPLDIRSHINSQNHVEYLVTFNICHAASQTIFLNIEQSLIYENSFLPIDLDHISLYVISYPKDIQFLLSYDIDHPPKFRLS